MSEPQQQPTPDKTPKKGRPALERADSEVSSTADDDQGYESRSRSQSRRRRRQNQRQRQTQSKAQAGNAKAQSMAKVQELPEEEEHEDSPYLPRSQWLKNPATQDTTEVQPFSRIKPPSQSMMGPVTYARMMRGEIPWQGPPPTQPYETTQGVDAGGPKGDKDPMDQDGLKLRIELNLDIEIELKASLHGDLTLALL